jgi:hypothetical protein
LVRVGGVTFDRDLVIDPGKIRKRKKGASRQSRGTMPTPFPPNVSPALVTLMSFLPLPCSATIPAWLPGG